ncbi:P-loop containing nucleoside triphosphate hydrolase protein, partial [Scenedesmus sp. NREL 46B-D3]
SVSVRVRPLNRQEQSDGFAWRIEKNSMQQVDPATREPEKARDQKYALDHIFGPKQSTRAIYEETTQSLIRKLVNGFNSTVFAYGQTSSGKTHTMRGTADEPGIIAMAVQEVFGLIESLQDREFLLRVSYMELYNEDINDLLAPENLKLPIHESKENGVYVAGLREDIVVSPEQVLELLREGEANRHIGATKMNEGSSRSHTVFRMVIESRLLKDGMMTEDVPADPAAEAGAILVSTLTLVDLAGSERVAKTGAEGIRMKEGTAINKSLLTLGNVINKLSEGVAAQGGHIPYRDSKLTRILQPSLGGNAKTAIICNITPASCHVEESHSTLRFACRAKRVMNNAVVNEVLSDAAVLKRQASEIAELRRALAASG